MMMVLPRRRSSGDFPASLFAGGEKGVIIDPSDLTTMWVEHDSQTTQVAADNDRVGTVTGFQNTTLAALSATGAASRGTYKVSGDLRFINFTTAQWLQGVIGQEIVAPLTILYCARAPASSFLSLNITDPSLGDDMQMCYISTADGKAYTWSRTNGTVAGNRAESAGVAASTIAVITHRVISSTDVSAQVNKNARGDLSGATIYAGTVNDLMAFPRIVDSSPTAGVGDVFFALVINRDLAAQELSDLQTYAGAKGGLTI